MPAKDTGPLDWRIAIVDTSGRPTQEFQRKWATQRANNALIGSVTFGTGAPPASPVPDNGAEYMDTTKEPWVLYIGDNGIWNIVGVQDFTDLTDVPGNYTSSADHLVRVNGNATGLEFITVSTGLDTIGNTTGDLLVRGNSSWGVLGSGTSGFVLTSGGAGVQPAWAAGGGGGGGGGSPPTIRGSGIQSANTSSFTVTWPTGSVAGDLAIICGGSGWSFNNPSGWVLLDNRAGSNANGAMWAKVLTSGDISTGSVVITSVNSYFGCVGIVTFQGATSAVVGFSGFQSAGQASPVDVFATNYLSAAMGIYWGYTRGTTAGTFAQGTLLQSTTTADGCAVLYAGTPTVPFILHAIFNSTSSSSGTYLGTGFVAGP